MVEEFHFEQLVTTPTRGPNILDLCFVSHPDLFTLCQTAPGISDHDSVIVEFSTQIKLVKKSPREIFLYHKANWDLIRDKMCSINERYFDLNSTNERSVEDNWTFFHDHYLQLIEEHVPKKSLSTKSHLPWMNTTLKRLLKKKQRTYNRAKKYQRAKDWDEYKRLQYQSKSIMRQQHKRYLSNLINPQNNLKCFWHYVKGKHQDNVGIGALKNQANDMITNSIEKAEILNKQFESVFTAEDTSSIPDTGTSPYTSIPDIDITLNGVRNLLLKSNVNKSAGPDNIHAAFLKNTAIESAPILTHLFKQSLRNVIVPVSWKQANVTPVYKKGDKTDPGNYRPVSLTSLVCKTLEHVLVSQIMKHLELNQILADVQYGFRSSRSCEAQLFLAVDDLARAVDNKLQVDLAILDFEKAFDKKLLIPD